MKIHELTIKNPDFHTHSDFVEIERFYTCLLGVKRAKSACEKALAEVKEPIKPIVFDTANELNNYREQLSKFNEWIKTFRYMIDVYEKLMKDYNTLIKNNIEYKGIWHTIYNQFEERYDYLAVNFNDDLCVKRYIENPDPVGYQYKNQPKPCVL